MPDLFKRSIFLLISFSTGGIQGSSLSERYPFYKMNVEIEDIEAPVNVLLIEDDEDDHIIINALLSNIQSRRYNLTWISDYQDSLSVLTQGDHDVCLLDYRLGINNGIDLLKNAHALGVPIPVIFLTGQGEYSVDLDAMKAGAADYLIKDELTSTLLERSIRYALDRNAAALKLQNAHDELEDRVRQRTEELKIANEKLQVASDKIKSFAYSISHDLKGPSIGLIGLSRRLCEYYGNSLDSRGKLYCEQISKAAEQVYSLVEMINSFIKTKEMPLKLEDVYLEELFQNMKLNYSEQISERKLSWIVPEKPPVIRADKMCIVRILANLIENALKYGGRDLSTIKIGVIENSSEYILTIGDDGKGIEQVDGHDIFRPFERLETNFQTEGNGLGLAIVKEMAEKHGGAVWYDSGINKWTNFHVSISKFI